jgi:hypothetical protein
MIPSKLPALILALACLSTIPAAAQGEHQHDTPEKLGKVDFPISCTEPVCQEFQRDVALLHSFAYAEAERGFRGVAARDPNCAMAWWGVAMTQFHPIWAAANPAAEPTAAEMKSGSDAAASAGRIGAPTSRENDYIAAVEAFYREPERPGYAARALAFEAGMERVHLRNPNDREAAIFHAMAMLGTASPADKTYAKQKQAAAILNGILPGAPEHPGIAHYLIHSFDYPELAILALPAARAYATIAPSAPHALHMPSHIFTRLGLWDESIRSNLASAASAREHVTASHPGTTSFDELHALDYLEYAYLQTGQDRNAGDVAAQVAKVRRLDVAQFAAAYALAAIPARFAIERRRWADAAKLKVAPADFPWERFPYAEALTHFARGLGSARSGGLPVAREALERLDAIPTDRVRGGDDYWAGQVKVQQLAVAAWIALAGGRGDEALRSMRSACDLEDASEKHPVTPGQIVPARELLGDMLMELDQPAQALVEYEASLRRTPGRIGGTYGAAHAAELARDRAKAREFYTKLEVLATHADGGRPELASMRAFLSTKD